MGAWFDVNATGIDFTNASFPDANLQTIDFSYAQLAGANLTGSNIQSPNFSFANLVGAQMQGGTNLQSPTWRCTICPDGTNSATNGTSPQSRAGHLTP